MVSFIHHMFQGVLDKIITLHTSLAYNVKIINIFKIKFK
jgi:hypothetical protein